VAMGIKRMQSVHKGDKRKTVPKSDLWGYIFNRKSEDILLAINI
jgi:hypothetical protein